MIPQRVGAAGIALLASTGVAGCSATVAPIVPGAALTVVAAESFWGSLAQQLGGSRVAVTSLVSDPNADPHEFESNTSDARLFARAGYVILNGAGYDDWGQRLLDSSAEASRTVLVVADVLGKHAGDNPHFWYSPAYVSAVIDRITADYKRIDPAGSAAFDAAQAATRSALQPYFQRVAEIKQRYHGVKVAATESIVQYLATDLGLDLISPHQFMDAIADGNEPPAASVAQFQRQLSSREARVLVYNVQTATSVTTGAQDLARQSH
ncbi:MAG TPA: zinc ABC transporter substrate-binding protein, partial [Candidatus Dormibacteraeota bacterium]|nr:zinc ABC transporter substrate-binding protein [Candidatus Dormibacteraeota bacterium]